MPQEVDYDPFAQTQPVAPPAPVKQSFLPPIPGLNAHGQPLTPAQGNEVDYDPFAAKVSPGEDFARSVPTGLFGGMKGLADQIYRASPIGQAQSMLGQAGQMADLLQGKKPGEQGQPQSPASLMADNLVGNNNPAAHRPQGMAGRFGQALGENLPALAAPGSAPARIANTVLPAVGAQGFEEGARALGADEKWQGRARILGGLLGGGAAALGAKGPTDSMLTRDTQGVTDAQIAQARALMENAPVRLTGAEAVQQVTGGASGLGTRQRVLEGTSVGRELFNPVMSQRPQEVAQAANQVFDQIAPRSQNPSAIGTQAQRAAEGRVTQVRQGINQAAEPHYQALQGQEIPPAQYQTLVQDPAYVAGLQQLRNDPILNGPVAHLPDNDLSVVNEVVKQIDQLGNAANPGVMNPQGNMTLSSRYGDARQAADDLAAQVSPDWRMARDIGAQGRQQLLEPMQAGPLGEVASAPDVQAQARALYPNNPPEGFANESAEALSGLGPVGADVTRQHLAGSFNEATQNLQGGPNQWGGAKFAAQVAGNPEQRAVLAENVGQVAPQAQPDLENLIQALEATGKRQPAGSQTAYNTEELRSLGDAGVAGNVLATGLNPTGTFRRMGEGFKDLSTRLNSRRLSEILLENPEEFERLLLRARSNGGYIGPALGALLSTQGGSDAKK